LFVKIIDIDLERRRISLSLKQANEGHEVEIEALPADLPHNLVADISVLKDVHSQILVSDIKLPTGVIMITKGNEVVASVAEQVEEKEEVPVAVDLSAIEVEKKGKKEEEGEAVAGTESKEA
jgi:ribosomal protein S1